MRLGAFLRDPLARELAWPLASEPRGHIHHDSNLLPVEHVTLRVGRPYTLRLQETRALFERGEADRATREKLLRELERHGKKAARRTTKTGVMPKKPGRRAQRSKRRAT